MMTIVTPASPALGELLAEAALTALELRALARGKDRL